MNFLQINKGINKLLFELCCHHNKHHKHVFDPSLLCLFADCLLLLLMLMRILALHWKQISEQSVLYDGIKENKTITCHLHDERKKVEGGDHKQQGFFLLMLPAQNWGSHLLIYFHLSFFCPPSPSANRVQPFDVS